MKNFLILISIFSYFFILYLISRYTGKTSSNDSFFTGDRKSPWYAVAYGMIGASLSGVTFISVPGWVDDRQFSYMQMVLGYLPGYMIIAFVLIPLYYKYNVVSIYTILSRKYGIIGYKMGSFFFLLSRTIGASFRLYLTAIVLQKAIFDALNIPFFLTVLITIGLIFLYTQKSGIKTVVWTDLLQTTFMILAATLVIIELSNVLGMSWSELSSFIVESPKSQIFYWDSSQSTYFWNMFFSGTLIAIVMTGLDQDMMQKNLTCRNVRGSKKNVISMSLLLVPINFVFLTLGLLLYKFGEQVNMPNTIAGDEVFPFLVFNYMPLFIGIVFILGVIAAAYSSADSALTALTTSFCYDFLGFKPTSSNEKKTDVIKNIEISKNRKTRNYVHLGFSFLIFIFIMSFEILNNRVIIDAIFKVAGYTYGPLFGLFIMTLINKKPLEQNFQKWIIPIVFSAPIISFALDYFANEWLGNIKFGYLILLVNGCITILGLMILQLISTIKHNIKSQN